MTIRFKEVEGDVQLKPVQQGVVDHLQAHTYDSLVEVNERLIGVARVTDITEDEASPDRRYQVEPTSMIPGLITFFIKGENTQQSDLR